MKEILNLPVLGTVRRVPELAYQVAAPVTAGTVTELMREPWCRRVELTDGTTDGTNGHARFRALCEMDGNPFIVTGDVRPGA